MISHKQTHKDTLGLSGLWYPTNKHTSLSGLGYPTNKDSNNQRRKRRLSQSDYFNKVMMVTWENITIYTSMFVNIIEPIVIQISNLI